MNSKIEKLNNNNNKISNKKYNDYKMIYEQKVFLWIALIPCIMIYILINYSEYFYEKEKLY